MLKGGLRSALSLCQRSSVDDRGVIGLYRGQYHPIARKPIDTWPSYNSLKQSIDYDERSDIETQESELVPILFMTRGNWPRVMNWDLLDTSVLTRHWLPTACGRRRPLGSPGYVSGAM